MDSGLIYSESPFNSWALVPNAFSHYSKVEKALMCKTTDRILFQQKKNLRTSSKVFLCSFMVFPQNHKKLGKPYIQQNHFQIKPNFGLQLGIQNPEKTVHSTPLINPHQTPGKKKKTWLVQPFFVSTTTTSQLPHPPKKKGRSRKFLGN